MIVTPSEFRMHSSPVVVNTGSGGQSGSLVFVEEQLVAVLVRIEDSCEACQGHAVQWFLEAGFGPCQDWGKGQVFATQDDAIAWAREQVLKAGADTG